MPNIFDTLEENYIKFENSTIQVIIDNYDKLWFRANDLANSLGYLDVKDAIKKHVDKNNKIQLKKIEHNSNIKGHPQTSYINESGMYKLILTSKLPKAKRFNNWITNEVLPSIRKFGFYKLKKEKEEEIHNLMEKLNFIQKENENMKKELKKEKYPDGGLIYAIDYSDGEKEIYRIGMTSNIKTRKKIYDTHSLYKKDVVIKKEHVCPIKLEYCIRGMLYDYRYKNNKDFYLCSLKEIKKAFKTCSESIECMEQNGGFNFNSNIKKLQNKIIKTNKEIEQIKIKLEK
jgi:prophage antirepressor-like protein